MKLIVGLGNPGTRYQRSRHNFGFMLIDYLAKTYKLPKPKNKFSSSLYQGLICNQQVILQCPQTFMNRSGEAIIQLTNYYKILIKDILILFDDVDLPFGSIRYRQKGSAGTHNGMKSIIEHFKRHDFSRLRLGIKTDYRIPDLSDFVLSPFSSMEQENLSPIFNDAKIQIESKFLI